MRAKRYRRTGVGALGLLGLGWIGCGNGNTSAPAGSQISIVSGDGQNVAPGQALPQPLFVRVTEGAGAAVGGTSVTWTVVLGNGTLGAAMTQTGSDGRAQVMYTVGSSPGPQRVRASLGAQMGAAAVEFAATALGATWPNNPSAFTTLSDWPFDALSGGGWSLSSSGGATIQTDGGAPLSTPNVGEWRYPIGFTGGSAPQTMFRGLPQLQELYAGYWWKPSNPWQGHASGVNKISFCVANDFSTDLILTMLETSGGYRLEVFPGGISNVQKGGSGYLEGNVNPNVTITLGQWHRVELYVKFSTTASSRDGIIRWWMDGMLIGNYSTATFAGRALSEWQFSPTWGGTGGTKTEQDYFWFDHTHLSSP